MSAKSVGFACSLASWGVSFAAMALGDLPVRLLAAAVSLALLSHMLLRHPESLEDLHG